MKKPKTNTSTVTVAALGLLVAGAVGRSLLYSGANPARGETVTALHCLERFRQPVFGVAFSPDGKTLATAGGWLQRDSELALWDAASGQQLAALAGHTGAVDAVAFSADGAVLASSGFDQTVRVWDARTGRELANLGKLADATVVMALSPDGKALAALGPPRGVQIWDIPSGRLRRTVQGFGHLAFSSDGRTLAVGDSTTVRLWSAETGDEQLSLPVRATWIRALAFSRDGQYLAIAGDDAEIEVWDLYRRKACRTLAGPVEGVETIAFSPDGRLLATGGRDRAVRLWDVKTGRIQSLLAGHEGKVNVLAFSPDGTRLASGSHDKTVRVWSLQKLM